MEVFLLIVFFAWLALVCTGVWQVRSYCVTTLASSQRDRLVVYLAPFMGAAILTLYLWAMTRPEVPYRAWKLVATALGALFWLPVASIGIFWLGLDPRDDVAERRNRAAGWTIAAAQVGLTLALANSAAQIVSTVSPSLAVFGVVASSIVFFAFWAILECACGLVEKITIGRDAGTACRLMGFLVALGFVIGPAVGSLLSIPLSVERWTPWVAPGALLLIALSTETWIHWQSTQPPQDRPRRRDLCVATVYLASASCLLWWLR